MKTLNFTDKELTYLLLSLKQYQVQLLANQDEALEDVATDLLFIRSLQGKLKALQQAKDSLPPIQTR